LVINELATNVTKHAWGGRDTLQITIRIDAEDDTVYFEFCDDGPGYPEDVLKLERQNAGLNLVQIVVSKNLGGELSLRNDHGAVTAIRFRLGA
jgi:two-component sensor histidine kinase